MTHEDRIEERMHELRLKARELSDAAANRYQLENSKKSTLALAMKTAETNGYKTVASQEREAYASAEYKTWLVGATEAVRTHERLRLEFDLIKLRFEAWRTRQATKRAEMQLQ
jgi:hypothetical protein